MNHHVVLDHDWFPSPLPENVTIGEGSWLHSSYALLHFQSRRPIGLRIGRRTGMYVETFFNVGPDGHVEIGDYCTLAGPIISTNHCVSIGDYVMISREVILADRDFAQPDHEPARTPQSQKLETADDIIVADDAWIGTRSVLLGGARLGRGAIVGAGTVVVFEVPDYAIVAGNPPRIVGWARPQDRYSKSIPGELTTSNR